MKKVFCTRITSEMILITIFVVITGAIADQVINSLDKKKPRFNLVVSTTNPRKCKSDLNISVLQKN